MGTYSPWQNAFIKSMCFRKGSDPLSLVFPSLNVGEALKDNFVSHVKAEKAQYTEHLYID